MGAVMPVESYSTYNVIYTSKEFNRELHVKGQEIRHSGVGGHHYNMVTDNKINNVVRISITMMIHAALRWPDASEKSLWPMAMAHDVHLHNHTTHIYSCMYSEEF